MVPPDPPDIRGYVARALRGGFPEARLFHLRDANGRHEVDILVELGDGRIIGIEVKAVAVCVRRGARGRVGRGQLGGVGVSMIRSVG